MARTKATREKSEWRRGYLCHVLYVGATRAGEIKTGKPGEWDGIYRWRTDRFSGETSSLPNARRLVEGAAIFGRYQLSLF